MSASTVGCRGSASRRSAASIHSHVVAGVALAREVGAAVSSQLLGAERPERLEQQVPPAGHPHDERALGQLVERCRGVSDSRPADRRGVGHRERSGEDRQVGEDPLQALDRAARTTTTSPRRASRDGRSARYPEDSKVKRWSRPAATSVTSSVCRRAAASSMASGSPSSRRTMSETTVSSSRIGVERRVHRPGSLHEELHGGGIGGGGRQSRQRRDGEHVLGGDAHAFTAGRR